MRSEVRFDGNAAALFLIRPVNFAPCAMPTSPKEGWACRRESDPSRPVSLSERSATIHAAANSTRQAHPANAMRTWHTEERRLAWRPPKGRAIVAEAPPDAPSSSSRPLPPMLRSPALARLSSFVLLLGGSLLPTISLRAETISLHVSPSGTDSADGSAERPVRLRRSSLAAGRPRRS